MSLQHGAINVHLSGTDPLHEHRYSITSDCPRPQILILFTLRSRCEASAYHVDHSSRVEYCRERYRYLERLSPLFAPPEFLRTPQRTAIFPTLAVCISKVRHYLTIQRSNSQTPCSCCGSTELRRNLRCLEKSSYGQLQSLLGC